MSEFGTTYMTHPDVPGQTASVADLAVGYWESKDWVVSPDPPSNVPTNFIDEGELDAKLSAERTVLRLQVASDLVDDFAARAVQTEVEEGRLSEASLTATIAAAIADTPTVAPVLAFQGLKATLAAGGTSVGAQVLGDSTGNESFEWPALMAADLAADHPAYTVHTRLWNDTAQAYDAPAVVQTGTAGESYLLVETGKTSPVIPQAAAPAFPSTADVRIKLAADDWTSAAANTVICGRENGAGQRSWWFGLTAAGYPSLVVSSDGTALTTINGGNPVTFTDGQTGWLRFTYTGNDGSGNRVTKFYTSTDGATWTQLGATITTAGTIVPFTPTNAPLSIGGRAGGAGLPGKIYEFWMLDAENGATLAPVLPALWSWTTSTPRMTLAGAPVLTIVNGSHPGAGLSYLGDATRLKKMTPHFGQVVTFHSDSHNDQAAVGAGFTTPYEAWRAAAAARLNAPSVLLTQNPQNPSQTYDIENGIRRLNLLTHGPARQVAVIDTYQTFLDNPNWLAQWMADTVHPNALGQAAWWGAIKARYDAA